MLLFVVVYLLPTHKSRRLTPTRSWIFHSWTWIFQTEREFDSQHKGRWDQTAAGRKERHKHGGVIKDSWRGLTPAGSGRRFVLVQTRHGQVRWITPERNQVWLFIWAVNTLNVSQVFDLFKHGTDRLKHQSVFFMAPPPDLPSSATVRPVWFTAAR